MSPDRERAAMTALQQAATALAQAIAALQDTQPAASGDRLMTAEEASRRTGMSTRWLYARADELPFATRIGRSVRFSEQGLEKWLLKHRNS